MSGDAEPLRHLPREWMYRAPLPAHQAREPAARPPTFDGHARGRRPSASRSPAGRGMVGHNWGAEHAATWIWLHGIAFDDAPDAWLDLSVGRVRVGPVLTPWIANGALHVDGRAHPARRPAPARRSRRRPAGCRVDVARRGRRGAPPPARPSPGRYADPGGGEHHSLNCSIAELRVVLDDGRELRTAARRRLRARAPPGAHGVRCSRSRTASARGRRDGCGDAVARAGARGRAVDVRPRCSTEVERPEARRAPGPPPRCREERERVSPPRRRAHARGRAGRPPRREVERDDRRVARLGSPSPARNRAASARSCAWIGLDRHLLEQRERRRLADPAQPRGRDVERPRVARQPQRPAVQVLHRLLGRVPAGEVRQQPLARLRRARAKNAVPRGPSSHL